MLKDDKPPKDDGAFEELEARVAVLEETLENLGQAMNNYAAHMDSYINALDEALINNATAAKEELSNLRSVLDGFLIVMKISNPDLKNKIR